MNRPIDENPFIERPDEHEVQGDELYCWMPGNGERQCGPDCVAFDPSFEDDGKTTCLVLNIARVAGVVAQVHGQALRARRESDRVEKISQKIGEIPNPPEVR